MMDKSKRNNPIACIILAAGQGTRMRSSRPKVLHPLFGKPVLSYVLDTVAALKPAKTVLVLGHQHGRVTEAMGDLKGITVAVQKQQKGTAHAVQTGMGPLRGFKRGTVLVVNGDTPLVSPATLRKFLVRHHRRGNDISVLSFTADDPGQYGRIQRDGRGKALRIVEAPDATDDVSLIQEVNGGVYAFSPRAMGLLKNIRPNAKKKEFYLTDILEIAASKKIKYDVYCLGDEEEFLGVNNRIDLWIAHETLRTREIQKWIDRGVSFMDTTTVYIEPGVKIGADTLIFPNVFLLDGTRVGRNCTIYPNVRISGSTVGDSAVIKDASVIEESKVGSETVLGPFAHLRPGSVIKKGAKIGNFVEVKKSTVGEGSKAMHLSYIGDASLGKGVNVGAGTITCNYDGYRKRRTDVGDGVFIGSDTQLVAPVKVGKGAYIGAGTTVTKNVPPGNLALSRTPQANIDRKKRRKKKR